MAVRMDERVEWMDGLIGWMSGWMNDVGMDVFGCYCWPFLGRLSGPITRGEMVVVSFFLFPFLSCSNNTGEYPQTDSDGFRLKWRKFCTASLKL